MPRSPIRNRKLRVPHETPVANRIHESFTSIGEFPYRAADRITPRPVGCRGVLYSTIPGAQHHPSLPPRRSHLHSLLVGLSCRPDCLRSQSDGSVVSSSSILLVLGSETWINAYPNIPPTQFLSSWPARSFFGSRIVIRFGTRSSLNEQLKSIPSLRFERDFDLHFFHGFEALLSIGKERSKKQHTCSFLAMMPKPETITSF